MYCLEANTLPGMTPTSLIPGRRQKFWESTIRLYARETICFHEKYPTQDFTIERVCSNL